MGSMEDGRPRRKVAVAAAVQTKSSLISLGCSKCRYAPGGCKGCRPPGMKDPTDGTPKKEEPSGSSSSRPPHHPGLHGPAELTDALAAAPPAYPTRRSGSTPITPLDDPELLQKASPQAHKLAALAMAKLTAVAAGKPEPKEEESESEEEEEEEEEGKDEEEKVEEAQESLASRSGAQPPAAVSSDHPQTLHWATRKGRTTCVYMGAGEGREAPAVEAGANSWSPAAEAYSSSGANGGPERRAVRATRSAAAAASESSSAKGKAVAYEWAPQIPTWPNHRTVLAEHILDWGFPMSSKDGKDSLCAKEDGRYGSPGATSRGLAELQRHFAAQGPFSSPSSPSYAAAATAAAAVMKEDSPPRDTAWTRLGEDASLWSRMPDASADAATVKQEPVPETSRKAVSVSDAEVQVDIQVAPPPRRDQQTSPVAAAPLDTKEEAAAKPEAAADAGGGGAAAGPSLSGGSAGQVRCKKKTHNWQCKNLAGDNAKGFCNKHFDMYCPADGPKRSAAPDRLAPIVAPDKREKGEERERAAAAAALAAAAAAAFREEDFGGPYGMFPPKRNRKPSMEAITASLNAAAEKKMQQGEKKPPHQQGGGGKERKEKDRGGGKGAAPEEREGREREEEAMAMGVGSRSNSLSKSHHPKKRLLEAMADLPPPPPVKVAQQQERGPAGVFGRCKRSDGKEWRCKHPAMDEHGFCEKHDRRNQHTPKAYTAPRTPKFPSEKDAGKADHKAAKTAKLEGGGGSSAGPAAKKHKSEHKLDHKGGSGEEKPPSRGGKAVPAAGDRVSAKTDFSKSCHQCMSQHVFVNCATCQSLSYCNNCLKLHYSQFTRQDVEAKCFKCRGVCICRGCLRRMGTYENPNWSRKQLTCYAAYLLREMEGPLSDVLKQQQEEAVNGPGAAELDEVQPGIRVTCERCKTSIPDVFRCCNTCGTDLCVDCCRELRSSAAPKAPHSSNAPGTSDLTHSGPTPMETDSAGPGDAAAAAAGGGPPPPPPPASGAEPDTEAAAAASESGELVCPKCKSSLVLKRFQPTDEGLLEAVPKVVAATRRDYSDAGMWQGPEAVDNGDVCGDNRQGQGAAEALPGTGVDDILRDREGPWREAALFPEGNPPPRLFCPQKELLAISSPDRSKALQLFRALWRQGQPIVVRGCATGKVPWTPECMTRACREKNARFNSGAEEFIVLECEHWTSSTIEEQTFFTGYAGREICVRADGTTPYLPMLKLKDFPAQGHFKDRLRRHYGDFLETLGSLLPEYTHPEVGPLNLGTRFPSTALPPDLGPKTYIAYGRPEELGEGDNVTKLHFDLSDAVNILSHMQQDDSAASGSSNKAAVEPLGRIGKGVGVDKETYGGAGAVWDIFRREDTPKLMAFLEKHKDEFFHTEFNEEAGEEGGTGLQFERKKLSDIDLPAAEVIHCQKFMLTRRHLETLHREQGIQPWHFEQYQNEAVFIPAGCAHQVRNLRSCTKVAVDFVSPESVPACLRLCESLRSIHTEDKLQLRLQMMWSAQWAVEQLVGAGAVGPEELGEGLYEKLTKKHREREERQAAKAQKKRKAMRPSATDDGHAAPPPGASKAEEGLKPDLQGLPHVKLEGAAAEFHWVSSPSSRGQPPEDLAPPKPDPGAAAAESGGDACGPKCKMCGKPVNSDEVKWINKKAFCTSCR